METPVIANEYDMYLNLINRKSHKSQINTLSIICVTLMTIDGWMDDLRF